MARTTNTRSRRVEIPASLKREVLAEAGYRCAVPTCRTILAIDLHHIIEVAEGGPTELSNLLALCPTCHALYTRGTIPKEAINVWKTTLVALNHAFDQESISLLHFLTKIAEKQIAISGDGVLRFAHLIASGLAEYEVVWTTPTGQVLLNVRLTSKGARIIDAWFAGNRERVKEALSSIEAEEGLPSQ